jgi:hypothetical protein
LLRAGFFIARIELATWGGRGEDSPRMNFKNQGGAAVPQARR